MTMVRHFICNDFFRFNFIELADCPRSLTYDLNTYLKHLAEYPEYFLVAEAPSGELMGYIMGKIKVDEETKHGHISLILCAPSYRRIGLARHLISTFENIAEQKQCWFIDLHVQVSNGIAIALYHTLGFVIYQTMFGYYWHETDKDAYNLRKGLFSGW